MKTIIGVIIGVLCFSACFTGSAYSDEVAPDSFSSSSHTIMHPDWDTLLKWNEEIERAPKAVMDKGVTSRLREARAENRSTAVSLRQYLDYSPADRDQGKCGNCWVWTGTGILEIADSLSFPNERKHRHSIQFFDSCSYVENDPRTFACNEGNLPSFAGWYTNRGFSIPWSNPGADFHDKENNCNNRPCIACSSINTTPNYPIRFLQSEAISTMDVTQAAAIENIKNVLQQQRGVFLGLTMPNGAAHTAFQDYWDKNTEADLFSPDSFCRGTWGKGGGGHAMLLLGYNDNDPNPERHYWLVLNSWGVVKDKRPNGMLRIPMRISYHCQVVNGDGKAVPAVTFLTLNTGDSPTGYSLSGKVRSGSESGPALSGATVSIAGKTAITTTTDPFTITRLPPGTYQLTISKTGYVTYANPSYTVSGNQANLNFVLSPNPTYSMKGTVYSTTGGAVKGATVSIAGQTATTDPDGAFTVANIPPAFHILTISKAGYVTYSTSYAVYGNQSNLKFTLTPLYSVSGKVYSTTGQTVRGAKVAIGSQSALTDGSGAFTVSDIPAGWYGLAISASGYSPYASPLYNVNSNQSNVKFTLTPLCSVSGKVRSTTGQAVKGAKVVIGPQSVLTDGSGAFTVTGIPVGWYMFTISTEGYVPYRDPLYNVGGNQTGLSFALKPGPIYCSLSGTVRAMGKPGISETTVSGATISIAGRTATSGRDGSFTVTKVPSGIYTLNVTSAGYMTYTDSSYFINSDQKSMQFYLTPLYSMSGKVHSGSVSGPGIYGASVSLDMHVVPTDKSGAFTITDISPGPHVLTISATGYATYTNDLYNIFGNQTNLDFILTKKSGSTMSGEARQANSP